MKLEIEERVSHIQHHGFPNCFGQQRFGKNNFKKAMSFFAETSLTEEKYQLKFTLQAYPSMYFNTQALERYTNDALLVDGDICMRRGDIRTRETGIYRQQDHTIELFDFGKIRKYTMDQNICTPSYMT
jgi:tRNA(Glu) U13 pseudouridine synthase TruD